MKNNAKRVELSELKFNTVHIVKLQKALKDILNHKQLRASLTNKFKSVFSNYILSLVVQHFTNMGKNNLRVILDELNNVKEVNMEKCVNCDEPITGGAILTPNGFKHVMCKGGEMAAKKKTPKKAEVRNTEKKEEKKTEKPAVKKEKAGMKKIDVIRDLFKGEKRSLEEICKIITEKYGEKTGSRKNISVALARLRKEE